MDMYIILMYGVNKLPDLSKENNTYILWNYALSDNKRTTPVYHKINKHH